MALQDCLIFDIWSPAGDFPGGPVVKTAHFYCRGQRELRSHMSHGQKLGIWLSGKGVSSWSPRVNKQRANGALHRDVAGRVHTDSEEQPWVHTQQAQGLTSGTRS